MAVTQHSLHPLIRLTQEVFTKLKIGFQRRPSLGRSSAHLIIFGNSHLAIAMILFMPMSRITKIFLPRFSPSTVSRTTRLISSYKPVRLVSVVNKAFCKGFGLKARIMRSAIEHASSAIATSNARAIMSNFVGIVNNQYLIIFVGGQ